MQRHDASAAVARAALAVFFRLALWSSLKSSEETDRLVAVVAALVALVAGALAAARAGAFAAGALAALVEGACTRWPPKKLRISIVRCS